MQLVADAIGDEATLKLMCRLGGVSIYIPSPGTEDILDCLRRNSLDVKVVAAEMNVSQSKVSRILREYRESKADRRQMTIFDSPDYEYGEDGNA